MRWLPSCWRWLWPLSAAPHRQRGARNRGSGKAGRGANGSPCCQAPAAPAAPAPAATAAAPAAAAPAAAKPSTYKIGHIVPLTGSNAEFGTSFNQTAQMAVDEINNAGGINGVKVALLSEDSMADPKQGISAFNKLVQVDKVPVVIGAWSTVLMATAPVADQNQVILINYGANATTLRGSGKFVFNTFPLADLDIKVLANYVYDNLKLKKGAILYINNDTGKSNAETFKAAFEAKGGKILANESHQPDAMDFGAQLAKIKAADPEIVHIPSLIQEMPRIVKQAREMGIKAQFTSYSVAEGQQMLDQGGDAADGLIYTFLAPAETDPERQGILRSMEDQVRQGAAGQLVQHVYLGYAVYRAAGDHQVRRPEGLWLHRRGVAEGLHGAEGVRYQSNRQDYLPVPRARTSLSLLRSRKSTPRPRPSTP